VLIRHEMMLLSVLLAAVLTAAALFARRARLRLGVLRAARPAVRSSGPAIDASTLAEGIVDLTATGVTLEQNGLVGHVHLGHGPGLYALVGRGQREYLYCDRCGAARALPPEALDPVREQIRQLQGFEARFTHFPIVGLCASCAGIPAPNS